MMAENELDAFKVKNPPLDARWAQSLGSFGLWLDLLMVSLALINLSWIVFDSLWSIPVVYEAMAWVVPEPWLAAYAPVHEHFLAIDLVFVAIFLSEFVARWVYALWTRMYGHWAAYPVLHWYDLLGCIPIAEFRWLRVLRIYAVLVRLKKMGVMDYTQWAPYRWVMAVYDIVMEEVSDRVVVKVLDGVQDELRGAGGIEKQILEQVVRPRQSQMTELLRERIVSALQTVHQQSRDDLREFVTDTVSTAVHENREIKVIDRIPVVGGVAGKLLDHAITDIVCKVIDEGAGRLSEQEFSDLFADVVDGVLQSLTVEAESDSELGEFIIDILDVVKEQVMRRRWLEPAPE
jgi:hypothetical protein